ncbi:FAD dependent oxidoreductase [Macroventuria anomochaeta]|uniref:FAD dependent oxidoreductase n=1 Tax=Macroventuria anomochaeta TaxID=301207 RepID=A0ACB6SIH3_9PLEO|nr:FAD dependent oxidoreductase [Macroventuria anomochaeta]KAF2633173.1 FAD dependent oxidoreductase [Macroventuria anomochaeta]
MTRQILPVPNPVTSYWLREPHAFADLQSTLCLPAHCDIAVIGAGLAGVLSAYHILKKTDRAEDSGTEAGTQEGGAGPRVVLIDARQLCSGATGRNGGHVKVQVNTLVNLPDSATDSRNKRSAFQDYVSRVMLELKHITEEEDLDCEFELRRSFDVFTSTADAESTYRKYEEARKNGELWTQNVSWIGADRAEQVTSIKGAKGAFSVPAASFWPYKFVTGLLERMVKRWGGEGGRLNVQMCTPVTSLNVSSSGAELLATHRGTITAAKVVLATNAYTAGLLPVFKGNIVPVRGMASHHRAGGAVHPHLTNTYNINFGPDKGVDYLNPRPDGGIVVGGGAWMFRQDERSWKNNFDDAHLFPPDVMGYWREYMQDRFLGWENSNSKNDSAWTGIMGRTNDGQPFVGRVPGREGVWALVGFNGGGMAIIALCARVVGRMIVEGKGFEDLWEEEGLLECFRCSEERLGSPQ